MADAGPTNEEMMAKYGRGPKKNVHDRLKGGGARKFFDSAEHAMTKKTGVIVPNLSNTVVKKKLAPNPLNPDSKSPAKRAESKPISAEEPSN